MSKLGNEPAYPVYHRPDDWGVEGGETIRQKYVRAAMTGLLAGKHFNWSEIALQEWAVKIADACLAEEARTRE